MLVLSRKVGERIVIGDGIVVVVKRLTGQRVTLGIEAPTNVHIVRGELKPLPASEPTPAPAPAPIPGPHVPNLHMQLDTSFVPVKPR